MKLCKVGEILQGLSGEYRDALQIALNRGYKDGGLSDAKLALEITRAGFAVSHNMVNVHRRQACRCDWSLNE